MFHRHSPSLIVVDDFYEDPDQVREIALAQTYVRDLRYFKGERSTERFLWPYLREHFARLLGKPVTAWLEHEANGVFQKTTDADPLVYHHDTQAYAGAVYLTPPVTQGTSFWRHACGVRKAPVDPVAASIVYSDKELVNGENWYLVDQIDGIYNRLVIWDAQLIHSASAYGPTPRLVQLFFFDA